MIPANLRDRISALSINDKKNISQQYIKLIEECGELAKVILPYDNADGTRHRFVDTKKLTEEVADIILCVISISDKLRIEDSALIEMLYEKTHKWENLQSLSNEEKYPYELHITVEEAPNTETFLKDCKDIGVKGILLALQMGKMKPIKDVMTSSVIVGSNYEVIQEINRISGALIEKGYNVVRQKAETVPWHPHSQLSRKSHNYFETHIQVTVPTESYRDELLEIEHTHTGCKVSRNALKKSSAGSVVYMLTLRDMTSDLDCFKTKLQAIYDDLDSRCITHKADGVVEWAIYDNNVEHDSKWMGRPCPDL